MFGSEQETDKMDTGELNTDDELDVHCMYVCMMMCVYMCLTCTCWTYIHVGDLDRYKLNRDKLDWDKLDKLNRNKLDLCMCCV